MPNWEGNLTDYECAQEAEAVLGGYCCDDCRFRVRSSHGVYCVEHVMSFAFVLNYPDVTASTANDPMSLAGLNPRRYGCSKFKRRPSRHLPRCPSSRGCACPEDVP